MTYEEAIKMLDRIRNEGGWTDDAYDSLTLAIKACAKQIPKKPTIAFKENELYQEIELFADDQKIGEAEIDIKNKMISRLCLFEPYQDKGLGTEIVKKLNEKYGCDVLWVNADNARAIHVYEKNGYKIQNPTMYLMQLQTDDEKTAFRNGEVCRNE